MKEFTYLVYILAWEGLLWGGGAYLVFWKDASPWWFVLILWLSCAAYKPSAWIHGKESK